MTNQPATTTTYRVTLADGTVEDIRAQKALIADGAAIFLVDGQMIEALAHSEWPRSRGTAAGDLSRKTTGGETTTVAPGDTDARRPTTRLVNPGLTVADPHSRPLPGDPSMITRPAT
jgi:hypothetical protein